MCLTFDAVTAAEDNMQSKTIKLNLMFDSVTAAEDNMKSKLPGNITNNTQKNGLEIVLTTRNT